MFLLHCPACGQRELRSVHALSSFANTDHGIELSMSCSRCGASVHTLTGARALRTEVRADVLAEPAAADPAVADAPDAPVAATTAA
jgi:hypothetical protein